MYSIQEVINKLGWQAQGPLVSVSMLILIGWVSLVGRQSPDAHLFAFLGVTSVLWTYHGIYDFVCVLPALLLLMSWEAADRVGQPVLSQRPSLPSRVIGVSCFVLLSLALSPPVSGGFSQLTHAIRWGGRLALLYVVSAAGGLLFRQRPWPDRNPSGSGSPGEVGNPDMAVPLEHRVREVRQFGVELGLERLRCIYCGQGH
jgi:hypothetical protein